MKLAFWILCAASLFLCSGCVKSEDDSIRPVDKPALGTETAPTAARTPMIIYAPGCSIPLPPDRKTKESSTSDWSDERGAKVAVKSTVFESGGEFTFTRETFSVPYENRSVPATSLRLVWIEELRVRERIFGYNIFVEATGEDPAFQNSDHSHRSIYRCYDSDGDGQFEYLINNSNAPPKVPSWVSSVPES